MNFDYDHGVSNTDGFELDIRAGLHTDTLMTLYHTPLWMEFFLAGNILDNDLSEYVGFNNALSGGTSVHWLVGPYIPKVFGNTFDDVDLAWNIQGTVGDNDFNGWKTSLSLNIVKF